MDTTVEILGLRGVEEALTLAGPKLAKAALRKALKAGGQIFVDAAKARAPSRTGALRKSIGMTVKLSPKGEYGTVRVGPMKEKGAKGSQAPGVYGSFVEFGTKDTAAQPFLRPAFDSAMEKAKDAFTAQIRDGVEALK